MKKRKLKKLFDDAVMHALELKTNLEAACRLLERESERTRLLRSELRDAERIVRHVEPVMHWVMENFPTDYARLTASFADALKSNMPRPTEDDPQIVKPGVIPPPPEAYGHA